MSRNARGDLNSWASRPLWFIATISNEATPREGMDVQSEMLASLLHRTSHRTQFRKLGILSGAAHRSVRRTSLESETAVRDTGCHVGYGLWSCAGGNSADYSNHRNIGCFACRTGGAYAEQLANSNVEYDLCGVGTGSYVYEVTQESSPKRVWTMHVTGTNLYRAFRIPSLYPEVQWR